MNSSGLKSSITSLQNETKRLQGKERDLLVANEAKLKAISDQFKAQKEEVKIQHEKDMLDLHEVGQAKLLESINEREAKLSSQQEMLQKTTALLDKSKQEIAHSKLSEIEELKLHHQDRYAQQFQQTQEMLENLNEKSRSSVVSLNNETEDTLQKITHDNKARIDHLAKSGELRTQNKSQEFSRLQAYQDMEFSKLMRQKEFEHDKDINELERSFLIDKEGRIQSFAQQKQVKTVEQQETLKQLDKSFHEKYQAMVNSHNAVMTHLRERFDQELNAAAQELSQTKATIAERENDSFYSIEKLNPTLTADEKAYHISLQVPEHERDQVNLSADGRQLRLSISRRFEQRLEGPEGEVNKTARTEHHTKSFNVPEIVDQRQISQTYQDGILSYKIMKA